MNEIEKGKVSGEVEVFFEPERKEYLLVFRPDGLTEQILMGVYADATTDYKRKSVGALGELKTFLKRIGVNLKE